MNSTSPLLRTRVRARLGGDEPQPRSAQFASPVLLRTLSWPDLRGKLAPQRGEGSEVVVLML